LKRLILLGAGVALSVVFLSLSLRGTDWAAIGAALRTADPLQAPLFLLALFAFYWLKALRWKQLLEPSVRAPTRSFFPPMMIGYGASALLPFQLGEILRAVAVGKRLPVSTSAALASIGLERIFDLATLLLIAGLAIGLNDAVPRALADSSLAVAGVVALAAAAAIVMGQRSAALLRWFAWAAKPLPEKTRTWLETQLERAASGLQALGQPRLLLSIAATSLLQWGFMLVCGWLSLRALHIDVPYEVLLALAALTVIGVSLPTAPGYIGSIQLAYTLALTPHGVAPSTAFAASVFYHVLAWLSVVVVGALCLKRAGMRFSLRPT
jgi:uncharacterized protein (TIRG00374 family)